MRGAVVVSILGCKPGNWTVQTPAKQWRRHNRVNQRKCHVRNTSALVAVLAVKSGNNKIIYEDILIALVHAIKDLSMPCHEQRTGAANAAKHVDCLYRDICPICTRCSQLS